MALRLPVIAAILQGYLLLLPAQFVIEVNGLVLPAYRMFLLGASLYVVAEVAKGRVRQFSDILIFLASIWIAAAIIITMGAERAISSGGAQFIDIALSYFFARCAIRSPQDLRHFLILIAPGLLFVGLVLAAEALLGQYFVQQFASGITGRAQTLFATPDVFRLGMLRGAGPFPHPILAGLFLSSFLALYLTSGLRSWPIVAGASAALLGFFSVSSAALLSLNVTIALLVVDWFVARFVNFSWKLFLAIVALGIFVAQFATGSGAIGLIMRFAALNQGSAFYRRLIWQYGTESISKHPWFGIGYNEWDRLHWMNSSIDNYWLQLAMQFGLVPPTLLLLAVMTSIIGLAKIQVTHAPVDAKLLRGVAIGLTVVTIAAFTVSIWLSMQVWFFMLLGITVSIRASTSRRPEAPVRPRSLEPDPTAHTRSGSIRPA